LWEWQALYFAFSPIPRMFVLRRVARAHVDRPVDQFWDEIISSPASVPPSSIQYE
jgi:hypothetical protein